MSKKQALIVVLALLPIAAVCCSNATICESLCEDQGDCNAKFDVTHCIDGCQDIDDSACEDAYAEYTSCRGQLKEFCKADKECKQEKKALDQCLN